MDGGCMCRQTRFSAEIDSDDAYLCHCRMCQRATGSVSIAFVNVRQDAVRWLSGPDYYQSSPIAKRPFCSACGTSLGFQFLDSENMDLTVASFDDPSRFKCTSHFGVESRLHAWDDTSGLPETRVDEHPAAVDRWMRVVGHLPG